MGLVYRSEKKGGRYILQAKNSFAKNSFAKNSFDSCKPFYFLLLREGALT